MKQSHDLGRIAGIPVRATRSIFPASSILWFVLGSYTYLFLEFDLIPAILAGLLAGILHWLGEIVHQLGHAYAAHRTGFPMTGILLKGFLGTSVYPPDEPELPPQTHIRRALGGPPFSLVIAVVTGVSLLLFPTQNAFLRFLVRFIFWENLLLYSLGALLPLGFTDGSTLLHYWRKR